MKTLREAWLDKHRAAQPQLAAIRRQVVAELSAPPGPARTFWENFRAEVLWPARWLWGGVGAAWLLIVGLQLQTQHLRGAKPQPTMTMEAWAEMNRQQQQALSNWTEQAVAQVHPPAPPLPPVADRPKKRSEGRSGERYGRQALPGADMEADV